MGLHVTSDIRQLLHHCRNRILLAGIELEGGWKAARHDVIRDGSVDIPPPIAVMMAADAYPQTAAQRALVQAWNETRCRAIGELPSAPMKVPDVERWMKVNYPDEVNQTCGLHVHMSFRDGHYMRLMEKEFQDLFIALLEEWGAREIIPPDHHFWSRLRGESEYCRLTFMPDQQVQLTRKLFDRRCPVNRYTALNYSWNTHGTLEVRVLPMFEVAEQSIRAVSEIFAIVNAYLVSSARKEKTLTSVVTIESSETGPKEISACV